MEKEVLKYIKSNRMLQHGDSVVLGVSGGADSLCMLIILNKLVSKLDLDLTVVHINHNLRGLEADNDQKFVEEFCENIGVKCIVKQIYVKQLAEEMKCSHEEAGRIARYEIFRKIAAEQGNSKIAIAHNLNDNSETVLLNLFRGTGIKGLSGILPKRDDIIRPIMCLTRQQIEEYLCDNNISYCTDSTNFEDVYTRNKIRHNIIPIVEEGVNSAAVINIAKTATELIEIEGYLEQQTEEMFSTMVVENQNSFLILPYDVHPIIRSRVIRRIIEKLSGKLKDINRRHIESVEGLFQRKTGSYVDLPYNIKAEKTYDGVVIWTKSEEPDEYDNVLEEQEEILLYIDGDVHSHSIISAEMFDINQNDGFTNGLSMENFAKNLQENKYTKWIDCDSIKGALVLRHRQTGDYLTIDGNGNKKKLKDYFINEKIPKSQRDHILLVADGHHIVWVVGHRISYDYKLNADTRRVLKLEYNGENNN